MSEYQYYEFLALDRRLTEKEMKELRAISSRAEITPTSFVNEYNYGNFRGDPYRLMASYFDAHVYVTNWGTHQLMLRVPRALVTPEELEPYRGEDVFTFQEAGESLILTFDSSDEGSGDWEEGSGWMAALAPVRAELLAGDRRALYLAWLLFAQRLDFDDEDFEDEYDEEGLEDDEFGLGAVEPPVPPGLGALSGPLASLADFLRIDEDLIAVAAERSPAGVEDDEELAAWIASLAEEEKNGLLLEAARGRGTNFGPSLLARFRASREGRSEEAAGGRTVRELLEAGERRREEREREEARRKAEERARKQAAAAKARAKYLDDLVTRQGAVWKKVEGLVEEKKAKPYDEAVSLLVDLRDVAQRTKAIAGFEARFAKLLEGFSKRPALLERLRKARLLGDR